MDQSKNALPDRSNVIFVVPTYMVLEKKGYTDKKVCFHQLSPPPLPKATTLALNLEYEDVLTLF